MNNAEKNDGGQAGSSPIPWRILCVDDEPDILIVLRAALSARYEVVTAQSGVEALKILGLCEPDFVICDLRMPGLDGFATIEAIRQIPSFADVPVFFLTAETSRDAARHGFEVGCNLYLTKPFDPMRLLTNIDYFTKESGHTVRPKSHTLAEVAKAIEAARRSPAPAPQPVPARKPVPPQPAPKAPSKAAPPIAQPPAASAAAPSSADLKAEHDALLADRKRREREHWKRRYAEMQAFIDQHMK